MGKPCVCNVLRPLASWGAWPSARTCVTIITRLANLHYGCLLTLCGPHMYVAILWPYSRALFTALQWYTLPLPDFHKIAICSMCLATLWPCAFGHFFCLGHTNLNLCCAGGNGLQVRLVGQFKSKNDSHMISGFYGNSNHVTSLHSRGIGALRIRQEIFLAALRVLTL